MKFPSPQRARRLFPLLLAALAACSSVPDDTIDDAIGTVDDPTALAARARATFLEQPRTFDTVERALDQMQTAAIATERGAYEERFERLRDATEYALWLARFARGGDRERRAHALRAVRLANTLVDHAPDRVEGPYYRAVATGLLAAADEDFGLDAVTEMEKDARRAVELDGGFESGGPHRTLGALYLEAPGPPLGPGSKRRAVRQLERARDLDPFHPGNLIFLARAYAARGMDDEAETTTAEAERALDRLDDEYERRYWTRELSASR